MKTLIALLLATLSISAAAAEYQIATTENNETVIFSDLPCPFGKDLSVARIISGDSDVYACYGITEKEVVFFFNAEGENVRISKEEIHVMKQGGI